MNLPRARRAVEITHDWSVGQSGESTIESCCPPWDVVKDGEIIAGIQIKSTEDNVV